jgi:hypothetical protein
MISTDLADIIDALRVRFAIAEHNAAIQYTEGRLEDAATSYDNAISLEFAIDCLTTIN